MTEKIDIKSMYETEIAGLMETLGEPAFRAKQVYSWLQEKLVCRFSEMTNLPKTLREKLDEVCQIRSLSKQKVLTSEKDGTKKYLFELYDGNRIESVMMPYKHGNSVCVSSQVGCNMGCTFCASTIDGCVRSLSASEILGQVHEIQKDIGERISNVVIMGMGEPLINYDQVVRFVRLISDEKTLHISQRNITISTCGIIPAIISLSSENLKVTLALSLHAPNDAIRKRIMPVANTYGIRDILSACDTYFEKTGRRVTFEYCLIDRINDREEHAKELAALLKGRNAHVNLIPVNPTPENEYGAAGEKNIRIFQRILEQSGITTTRRREMGRDISGACGQLVRRKD